MVAIGNFRRRTFIVLLIVGIAIIVKVDANTLVAIEGRNVTFAFNGTVNTRLFKLAREDKSVIVDYQDPNLNDKIQSVFHNAVCNPQNGTLTLRGIKLEDTGKWYCEQTIQDSTQQTTDTRIHQTAFFLDVQQQATIEISLATKEGLARCRSLGGYPKVSMRAVVSTDPTGTASTQELRAKRHASNVALNAEDTDFEFDPDQVPHEHYIVCIGEQFRQGRVVIRPTNYIQWRGPDYEHPSPAEESNVMLFSNSNEWVHGHSQNITCKQAGGLPESSLSIFLSEDQEGKRLLKTLDIVMEESFQESANLRTLVSRYNPNLTDENIFIVCQEQQSTGSDGTVTAIKDNIRIGNVKYAPTIEDKKNHYRIQANPLPGLEDISLWKCNDPDCQSPGQVEERCKMEFVPVSSSNLNLWLSCVDSSSYEKESRNLLLRVENPHGLHTKVIPFLDAGNASLFQTSHASTLIISILIAMAVIVGVVVAIIMVNKRCSKSAGSNAQGSFYSQVSEPVAEWSEDGSMHYYESINPLGLKSPFENLLNTHPSQWTQNSNYGPISSTS